MMWIAGSARSREIDRRSGLDFGVPAMVLMERAGLAVFDAVRELLPSGGHLAILCGRGNNGGDGFAVARHAKDQGFGVECIVAANEADLSLDAATQCSVAKAQGVSPIFVDDPRWERSLECISKCDLAVDALLGTGAQGDVRGAVLQAIHAINRSGVPVVSVDIPSGISCDTGEELGESVWAVRTITFGLPKPFLFQGIGLEHSGFWSVADIGFPAALLEEPTSAGLIDSQWVANMIPERLRASHKGDNGHVLIVAGSKRMPGAASLAARAALRSGAGLVTVAAIDAVCQAVAANVPEAILCPLPDSGGMLSTESTSLLVEAQSRCDSALFGPGLTHERSVLDTLNQVWRQWSKPCCIDADALNAVSQGVELPNAPCVLTPHPGELSRLLKTSIAEIQSDRFRSVSLAAETFGQTVILKGPYSIVGDGRSPLGVNCTGNSGMASAGMGDVLSGVVTTLLGQGLPPYPSAACGMFWHGAAGDFCAHDIGFIGFSASDVANALPKARAKLTEACCSDRPDFSL